MALPNALNFQKKYYCIITGASQGIGQTIAIEIAQKFGNGSRLLLLARSDKGLNETSAIIQKNSPNVEVVVHAIDLSNPDSEVFNKVITESLKDSKPSGYDCVMIIHNAGSVGDVSKKASTLNDINIWQKYYTLNVFGVVVLNSEFMSIFKETHNVESEHTKMVIVNITSLVGIKPFKGMAYYGSGKAAREMIFNVLAQEETNVLVLNYSPGPVDTNMLANIVEHIGAVDPETKVVFVTMKSERTLLTTGQTTSKLLEVLQTGNYKSGQHVDYFD